MRHIIIKGIAGTASLVAIGAIAACGAGPSDELNGADLSGDITNEPCDPAVENDCVQDARGAWRRSRSKSDSGVVVAADSGSPTLDSGVSVPVVQDSGSTSPTPPPTTPPPAGLPAGVTLTPPDGGQHYNQKFANGLPDDKNFFPISVFSPFDLLGKSSSGKTRVQTYVELGINTLYGPANGVCGDGSSGSMFIDVAKANGLKVFGWASLGTCGVDDTAFKTKYANTLAGWVYQDEAEGNPCSHIDDAWLRALCKDDGNKIYTSSFIAMSDAIRAKDPARPVVQGFTQGYALDWYLNGTQLDIAKSSDVLTYDVYSLTDRRCYPNYDGCGKQWGYYTHVTSARKGAQYTVPIWPDIEVNAVFDKSVNPTQYQPTAADVKVAVMQSVVAGARGIQYFKNCFCDVTPTQDSLVDSRFASVNAGVAEVDAQLKRLAYVINSDFANGFHSVAAGNVNTMAKYDDRDGAIYIFAAAHQEASQSVTFAVKAGATVTVVDENRTIPISGGKFSDTFASATAYHIYKVQ